MKDDATATNLLIRFRGSYGEFEDLRAVLTKRFGSDALQAGAPTPVQGSLTDEGGLGQVELVEVVIHFLVAFAAHISATQVHEVVRDYLRSRRSVQVTIEEPQERNE